MLANDYDPERHPLTIVKVDEAGEATGEVSIANGFVHYDPNGQYEYLQVGDTATDSFEYTLVDSQNASDSILDLKGHQFFQSFIVNSTISIWSSNCGIASWSHG